MHVPDRKTDYKL